MDAMLRILSLLLSAYTMLHGMYQSLPSSAAHQDANLLLVNRTHMLSAKYEPELVQADIPPDKEQSRAYLSLTPEAAHALEAMFKAAKEDGIKLYGVSGYRSYANQSALYRRRVEESGEKYANQYIAQPGASEHQTGLTMDVIGESTLKDGLVESFASSPEGVWVTQNAHRFGFIIRYPLGKEEITGYSWEPWHLRYVGMDHAAAIYGTGRTLEEYLVHMRIAELEQLIAERGLNALVTH